MKLKWATLLFSALSSSAFAVTYNIATVINSQNQTKIENDIIAATLKNGVLNTRVPSTISGSFSTNSSNQLVNINIDHLIFTIINVPLVGAYTTDFSIQGTINGGDCSKINITLAKINSGNPAFFNTKFQSDLINNGTSVIDIIIKSTNIKTYCAPLT